MASVINYIGLSPRCSDPAVTEDKTLISPDGNYRWDPKRTYSDNIQNFSPELQLKGYLEQLIAISYYISFYEKGLNLLVDDYIDETITNFEYLFLPKFKQAMRDTNSFDKVLESTQLLAKQIKTGRLDKELDVEAISMFRDLYKTEDRLPVLECQDREWMKPYLIWLNYYWTGYGKVHSCTVMEGYGIISFYFSGFYTQGAPQIGRYTLGVRYYPMSTTFCAGNSCQSANMRKVRIYDYLARFNLAGVKVEKLIGTLGDLCLTLDVCRPAVSHSQKVMATIRARVLGLVTYAGSVPGLTRPLSRSAEGGGYYRGISGIFDATRDFIDFITRTYGATLEDRNVVINIFDGFAETKEQKDSVNYLREQGGSASADDLNSFKKELGSLEALQFISQNNALLVAQSQATSPQAAADGEDTENKESESKEEDSKSKETESDKSDDKDSGDDSSGDDQTDEAEEDDTSEEEEEDAGDEGGEEGSGDGGESSDTSSSSDVSDMPSDDEQPNTSDPKGFKFKVANPEAETTDSVMFREEMDHFLSNILANPPEDLSPQTIQTLTSLHRYWLHTLSIGTIMGIVGSCIKRLPESLTKLSTQCTE